jgi:L-serine dehydratase
MPTRLDVVRLMVSIVTRTLNGTTRVPLPEFPTARVFHCRCGWSLRELITMQPNGFLPSLTELFRIGRGPSSSHTIGPQHAARQFRSQLMSAGSITVELFGSLAATGRGHGTDAAIAGELVGIAHVVVWNPDQELPLHPNGMRFTAYDDDLRAINRWEVYSVGGGALRDVDTAPPDPIYPFSTMAGVLEWCRVNHAPIWQAVEQYDPSARACLQRALGAMDACVDRGLQARGTLPGALGLQRKAADFHARAERAGGPNAWLAAFALAAMEENAAGGVVVTAPTCGACGVVPAVLRWHRMGGETEQNLLRALATAGLVGAIVKQNASISGAEVGCQGEVGTACAMAAAASCQLMGGTSAQIEYAAEMALEHHLGLTCDPVLGLVQMPCIERNAFAAIRAVDAAEFALVGDGRHHISFDEVVQAMALTGRDLHRRYRETAEGGLALVHSRSGVN